MRASRCSVCGADAAGSHSERLDSEIPDSGIRLHELLTSNEPPEDNDLDIIHSAITKTNARLAFVDEEISRLRDSLKYLEEERHSLLSYQAQNRGIMSPLRRMPPEVLSQIFTRTLPSTGTSTLRAGSHTRESPWILTHVSSQWRTVAVSDPSLWSLLTIIYRPNRDPSSFYPLSMVETQISRAQKLNLHFFGCETIDSRPQVELFRCLAKHASQWEELWLELTSALSPLLPSLRGRLPSLRKLWIQWDCQASQAAADSIDCFQVAPSLIDVGIYNEFRMIPISLPVQQLTRYQIDAPWAVHQGILKLVPGLIEAHISVKFDIEPWSPNPQEIIELPSLNRLYSSAENVFDRIRVPALADLTCRGSGVSSSVVTTLQSLIARSSFTLRCLCFYTCPAVTTAFAILRSIPSIAELRIVITESNYLEVDTLMEALTVSEVDPNGVVAPQLPCISLGCHTWADDVQINYSLYLGMVKSRWKADYCALTKSELVVPSKMVPDDATLRGLQVLREEGLDLFLLVGADASDVLDHWLCYSRY